MWGVVLIYIAVASCELILLSNAELYQLKTAHLPTTVDDRIIGGSATTIEQYPFAVQVMNREKRIRCAGTLVTTIHVLSAAHCFVTRNGSRFPPKSYSVRASTTMLNSGGSVHFVTAIKAHELYDFKATATYNNDVAVVLMETPVDLTTSVARPVLLPYQDAVVPDNSFVTAVGWGRTNETHPAASAFLNQVTVRMISQKTCRARYKPAKGKRINITNSMICAGILDDGGKDTCQGDSGGPLLYKGIIVGVTSWGRGCANPKYPGVYARVASYTNWINYTINESLLQKETERFNAGSLSSKIGAITLLTSLLYSAFSCYKLTE